MAIKIGSKIKSQLPGDQKDGLEEYLWSKCGGVCHLCDAKMNQASETIEADHDVPEAAGGLTSRDNLWLAHTACNRAKRDNPSVAIRPYLRLKSYMAEHGHVLKYDGVLGHFDIEPAKSKIESADETLEVDLPDGTHASAPIFEDKKPGGRTYRYAFISLPQVALKNDDEVQPRSLKIAQVWSIYSDLAKNPLHEPPSCRVIATADGFSYFGLFDGQHKTVATWMTGADRVVVKVYLDLSKDDANFLVNSIQAKIKKLPLSPFELSAKLSEEWMSRLDSYRDAVSAQDASEDGFIQWLEKGERSRAKGAFEAALLRDVLDGPELGLKRYVHRSGQPKTDDSLITETQFNTKILKRMLHTSPLAEQGQKGEECRQRERDNIVNALNVWTQMTFDPKLGAEELTSIERERRRRMLYGGAMALIADLLTSIYRQVLACEPGREFLDKVPSEKQEAEIRDAIQLLVEHPIWTVDLDSTSKTVAFGDALSKNQDVSKAAGNVGLKLGYLIGADELPNDWMN